MHGLAVATRWEMIILLGGLMAAVVYKLLTGGIDMSGLLTVKGGKDDGTMSAGRVQMMMATLYTALYYLMQLIGNPHTGSLPPVPGPLVGVLAGSHAIYLGGKAFGLKDLLLGKKKNDSK